MISFLLGLIALQSFKKEDELVDYHGKRVTNINADQYCLQPGVLSEYVLQVAGPPRSLIDASNEECSLRNWNVCLGRLANHATQKKNEANMKMVEVVLSSISERIIILKARRDIAPFEQLRFDYGDKLLKRCLTTAVKWILGILQNFNLVSFCGTFYQFSSQFTNYKSAFVFMILYFKPVLIYGQIY